MHKGKLEKMSKKIKLGLDKNKKYIVACSFGPDSMALLNLCLENKLNISVAHVNYYHRDESLLEEKELRKFCKEKKIHLSVLNLKNKKVIGNFEAWAREQRYSFFSKFLKKEKAEAVLVAHHQDDLIETYLMQKKRRNYVKRYGIAYETEINGVKIIRPLLDYKKDDLLCYCKQNKIPYSIDKTNLTNELTRNKIRHEIVEKLNEKERAKILKEINSKKKNSIKFKTTWDLKEFLSLDYASFIFLIDECLKKAESHKDISEKFYKVVLKSFSSSKANVVVEINEYLMLNKANEKVYFINRKKIEDYEIKINKNEVIKTEFLTIDLSNNFKERNLTEKSFPITIKNINPSDEIKVTDYQVKVRRLFIDWKMPAFLRKMWPGIYDKNGTLMYTPRYREKYTNKHKSVFIINAEYLTKFWCKN